MLVHWIWFATRPGLHDRARLAVLEKMQDIAEIYRAGSEDYSRVDGLRQEDIAALADKDLTEAQGILQSCASKKIRILTYDDPAYPQRLKNIADPPVVLYCKGNLPDFDREAAVGVVGTRKASVYGLRIARKIGADIARCGGLVVSGLAAGIDAAAMDGAVSEHQAAVGVLGCGVDVVFPKENRALFKSVLENGCILSEFPPGTRPYKWNFPKRNRIISGLSCGVLVVEAPEKSGALITARQAAEQGRDVFVVPGNVDTGTCTGSNALLRDGAVAVSSGWELLSEYEALYPDKLRNVQQTKKEAPRISMLMELAGMGDSGPDEENPLPAANKMQKDIDNTPRGPYSDLESMVPALTPDQKQIVSQLAQGQKLVDAVIADSGLPASRALAALTLLEIQGAVSRLPGKMLSLKRRS